MPRASRCGQVIVPSDSTASARSMTACPEPVGAADREGQRGGAGVAPAGEPVGQLPAAPGRAALVERDEPGTRRQRGEDQLGLALLQLGRRQAAFFFDFDDCHRRHDAPGVKRLQIVKRPAAQPADREEIKADRARSYCSTASGSAGRRCRAWPTPHIFSRL